MAGVRMVVVEVQVGKSAHDAPRLHETAFHFFCFQLWLVLDIFVIHSIRNSPRKATRRIQSTLECRYR
jgi:hypothetical protein